MSDKPKPETADRLAKVMARAGLCSRRDAEGWIAAGRVMVNGKKVITPAFNVTSRDKITVDGQPLAERQGTRVWLYHKPAGLVVTEKDPEGRRTIFEELDEKGLPRVVTVGRLDINTEGLLLLTNDGGLKRVLELPSTGWLRRYRVRAYGYVAQTQLDALKDGITVEGINYGPIEATLERQQGHNSWIVVGLREGKNREVKNVLGALGLEVNRLIRVSYGPFQLGDLAEGEIEMVKAKMLKDQLGKKLAEAANVDFDSEMPDGGLFPPPQPLSESPRSRGSARKPSGLKTGGFGNREDDRPVRPRRIHFDEDGRAPEEYEPKGDGKPARGGDRPERGDQPMGERKSFGDKKSFGDRKPFGEKKSFGDRKPFGDKKPYGEKKSFGDKKPYGAKSFGERPTRSFGGDERPARPYGDRPQRGFGDKPARSGGERPARPYGDRPQRSFGDKPARGGGERPTRPYGDRPERGAGDRPQRPYGDRPQRSFGDKPARGGGERPTRSYGDRPERGAGDRPQRPYGDRPQRGSGDRPERSGGERPQRPYGDRPARPYGDRPQRGSGDRPERSGNERPQRPYGDRPGKPGGAGARPGGKSFGDKKPFGGKPSFGDKPRSPRPEGGRPGGKPFGARPGGPGAGGRPGGKPSGARPGGPKKPRG